MQYRRHLLTIAERLMVDRHLRDCDFCSAEVHLLRRHREVAEATEPAEMPPYLRGLAESLFARRPKVMTVNTFMLHSQMSH